MTTNTNANTGQNEERWFSKRMNITMSDASYMDRDKIADVIKRFKSHCIASDNKELDKLKVNGRVILYKQLAQAYQFGHAICKNVHTQDEFKVYLNESGRAELSKNFNEENKWNIFTAVLYGNWETVDGKEVFKRDRSAEKYANVLRCLMDNKVKSSEVVEFIQNFVGPDGERGILGMEKADRLKHRKQPKAQKPRSQKQIDERNRVIARGESFGNDDVFEMPKPKALSDDVEYGRAVFKIVGDNMVIVGFDTWERPAYERHVIARGKDMIAEEAKIIQRQKDLEDKQRDSAREINSDFTSQLFGSDSGLATELLEAGVKPSDIAEKMIGVMKDMLVVQRNTTNLEQSADRVSD